MCRQAFNDIEWLIVDDGSSDETKCVVEEFQRQSDFSIRYVYQENRGKPSAFNHGVLEARGKLFFCVDSDDYLADDALEKISDLWRMADSPKIAGILGGKQDTKGNRLCDRIPTRLLKSSLYDLTHVSGIGGEFSLIFRTALLKNFLFPIVPGEKFVTECVVYDRFDLAGYTMLLSDDVMTVCEYQPGGLSDTAYALMMKNPTGYLIFYSQRIDLAKNFKERIGYILRYRAFWSMCRAADFRYVGRHSLLVALLAPFGCLLKKIYQRKAR